MKKYISLFLMLFVLMFSSCEVTLAADYVEPMQVPGVQYIDKTYDTNGNALVKIDMDLDGTCDLGALFQLKRNQNGKMILVPTKQVSCAMVDSVRVKADIYWKAQGMEPMIFDNDINKLVPLRNREI